MSENSKTARRFMLKSDFMGSLLAGWEQFVQSLQKYSF
jgi:hypothetical protein